MKQQNKQGLLILCPWILGFAAAFLRRALYIQATDIKGLLIRNHPLALILWALVGLAAAFVLLSVRKLGGPNGYEENFGKALPTGYLLLAAVIGIGAKPADSGMMFMEGRLTAETEAKGTRDTGRGGLRVYIIET